MRVKWVYSYVLSGSLLFGGRMHLVNLGKHLQVLLLSQPSLIYPAFFLVLMFKRPIILSSGTKKKAQTNCRACTIPTGLTKLANTKEQVYLFEILTWEFVKASRKRLARWAIANWLRNLYILELQGFFIWFLQEEARQKGNVVKYPQS
ncbi:hypothetical protein [Pontibacter litorisediminis]|uniref:hypothetical protein n=1 Tax=Pontibacter litorisediminis TaxID=1846260 RepID=UPI0023EB0A83|nr:hypothetical protein [Pontibacter litorisediminis]